MNHEKLDQILMGLNQMNQRLTQIDKRLDHIDIELKKVKSDQVLANQRLATVDKKVGQLADGLADTRDMVIKTVDDLTDSYELFVLKQFKMEQRLWKLKKAE